MSERFDDAAMRRIADAVAAVERGSCVELVVEVRARCGSYAYADARFAAVVTVVSLVLLMYVPIVVPPLLALIDVIAVYAGAFALAQRMPGVRRWLTPRDERAQRVRTYAAAAFYERGVANTSRETGMLFFASLLERRIEVLADRGVLRMLDPKEWNALLAKLREERDLDVNEIVEAIGSLATLLARDAPATDDVNELPNAPEVSLT